MRKLKNKKLVALFTMLSLVCAVFIGSFAYALFSANSKIDAGYGSGEVKYALSNIKTTGDSVFAEPGQVYTKSFDIKNTGDTPFNYSLKINLTRETELLEGQVGIENAIFVYIDSTYYGLLSNVANVAHELEMPLAPSDGAHHEIKFEYHIDAYANYNNSIHLDADISSVLALNYDSDYVFVDSFAQLQQHARKSDVKNRTIFFTSDITFTKDITFKTDVDFNLNSHILNLNGHKLSFSGSNISSVIEIDNRVDTNEDRALKGYISGNEMSGSGLIVNTPNGLVLDRTNCSVITFGTVPSQSYSAALLLESARQDIVTKTKNGIYDSIYTLEGYALYVNVDKNTRKALVLTSNDTSRLYVTIENENVQLSVNRFDFTTDTTLTLTATDFDSQTINVRIWGNNDDATIERYLVDELNFLQNYSTEYLAYVVDADIFLPAKIQALGAKISWKSNKTHVISTIGKFFRPYKNEDTNVELTAYVTYNNINYIKSYSIYVQKKSADDILKEIIYELESKLTFAYVFESKDNIDNIRELVVAEDYADRGVTSLIYQDLATEFEGIFRLDKNAPSLELLVDTVLSSAHLEIAIAVTDGEEVVNAEGSARIKIEINRSDNIFDAMYNNFLGYISHINGNTLASFDVPDIYLEDTNTYAYFVLPGKNYMPDSDNTVSYTNPSDCGNYISVASDGKKININPYQLPNENTDITILVKMTTNPGQASEQNNYRLCKVQLTGVLLLNRDIEDANLFYELRKLIDRDPINGNNDGFISRDEIDAVKLTELDYQNSYVSSLVGLEYFTTLESINLSGNEITDTTPLSTLYNLRELCLDNNRIINISNLGNLTNLEKLSLSSNEIVDISNLKYLTSLTTLHIDNNVGILDLEPISNMTALRQLDVYNTAASDATNLKFNLNYLITQYQVFGSNSEFHVNNASTWWRPTTDQINANTIINYIEPIEEIGQVIILPTTITYNGVTYQIYWENTESSQGIITIDEENGRAYVKQPIADVEITLMAYIKYGSEPIYMYKVMNILSKKMDATLSIIQADGTILTGDEVLLAIPDDTLRQYLFTKYGVDGTIDIPTLINNNADGVIDLSNSGVRDISGLELFKDLITELNVNDTNLQDFSPVADLGNLTNFIANSGKLDVSIFQDLTNLKYLYVYGCEFYDYTTDKLMDEIDVLGNLYKAYKNNSTNNIRIFYDATSEWNPFIQPMNDALTMPQSIYVVAVDRPVDLPSSVTLDMYGVEEIPLEHTWTDVGGYSFFFDYYTVNVNSPKFKLTQKDDGVYQVTLAYKDVTAVDTFAPFDCRISMVSSASWESVATSVRRLMVMQSTIGDMMIELEDGTFALLNETIINPSMRGSIITLWSSGNTIEIDGVVHPYISRAQILNVTSLNFTGLNGNGLDGIEQFYGSTKLTTITIEKFNRVGYGGEAYSLSDYITQEHFPNLTTLNISRSYVDISQLAGLTSLTTLKIENSVYLHLDEDAFASMTGLTSLTITNSGIFDFTGIQGCQHLSYLNITSNVAVTNASLIDKTNAIVTEIYNNYIAAYPDGTYTYYVTSGSVLWSPADLTYLYEYDVHVTDSANNEKDVGYPGRNRYETGFLDQIDDITYLSDGDFIYLPTTYNGLPIKWTSSSDYVLALNTDNIVVYNGLDYYRIQVRALSVKTYGTIYGKVYSKELVYAFVIDEDGSMTSPQYDAYGYIRLEATDGALPSSIRALNGTYVIDLNTFFTGDKVEDPTFMTSMFDMTLGYKVRYNTKGQVLTSFPKTNYTGLFTSEQASSLFSSGSRYGSEIRFSGNDNSYKNSRIVSMKGVKNFYNTTSINIDNLPLTTIDEVAYLDKLTSFLCTNTLITSLSDKDGHSIFANAHNLNSIKVNGNMIEDYSPIAYEYYYYVGDTLYAQERPAEDLIKLNTIFIYPYTNYMYTPEMNVHTMLSKWWDARKNGAATSLNVQINGSSGFSTTSGIETLVSAANALMTYDVSGQTFDLNDTLPSSLTEGSSLYWTNSAYSLSDTESLRSTDIGITIDASNKITAYKLNTDGWTTVAAYVGSNASTRYITREMSINISSSTRAVASKVEISATEYEAFTNGLPSERNYYDSLALSADSGSYYVDVAAAMPDTNLRKALYYYYDANNDGIISLTERSSNKYQTRLSLQFRGIASLKGIELFPKYKILEVYGNSLKAIDNLLFPTDHMLIDLQLGRGYSNDSNRRLNDLSGLIYDGDGDGTKYKAISYSLTKLNLTSLYNLSVEATRYLTNTDPDNFPNFKLNYSALTYLCIDRTRVASDLKYAPYLPQTLNDVPYMTSNNQVQNNNNQRNSLINFDRFVLNSVYSTNSNKRLMSTKLQECIPFDDFYTINASVKLPQEMTIYGSTYQLGYVEQETGEYRLEYRASENAYYFTPFSAAGSEVEITAFVYYNHLADNSLRRGYQEAVKLNTSSDISSEDNLYYVSSEGTIQLTNDGPFEDLRLYVKDPALRWHMFNNFDKNPLNNQISYQELTSINSTAKWQFGDSYRTPTTLEGIEILAPFNVLNVSLSYCYLTDYSPVAALKKVTDLEISNAGYNLYYTMGDLSFINEMPFLKTLSLNATTYLNMDFLYKNTTLEKLVFLDGSVSIAIDALYIRNAWAYARANGALAEDESSMSNPNGQNPDFVSTAKDKLASYILNQMSFAFDIPLPTSVVFENNTYGAVTGGVKDTSFKWVSVSPSIVIDETTGIATSLGNRNKGAVLCIFAFQGRYYERMFVVDC